MYKKEDLRIDIREGLGKVAKMIVTGDFYFSVSEENGNIICNQNDYRKYISYLTDRENKTYFLNFYQDLLGEHILIETKKPYALLNSLIARSMMI